MISQLPLEGPVADQNEKRSLLDAIIESFEGEIFICSRDFRLQFMNGRLAARLGEQALGQPCYRVVHGLDKPCPECVNQRHDDASAHWETCDARDGRCRYVVASPLRNERGPLATLCMMIDISERKQAEEQLQESRDLYRGLVETMPLGVVILQERRVAFANPAATQNLGLALAVGAGQDFLDLAVQEDRPRLEQYLSSLAAQNASAPASLSAPLRRADGTPFLADIRAGAVNFQGAPALQLLIADVSAQRRERERLLRLASVVAASPDAILSVNLEGVIQSWNPGAERLYGFSAREAVGRPVSIIVPPDRADEVKGVLAAVGRGHTIEHLDTRRRRKDGSLVEVSLTVAPIVDADGEVLGAASLSHDISERLAQEEAIAQLARFPGENPHPVMRVSLDGRLVYANAASWPVMQAWGLAIGQPLPPDWAKSLSQCTEQSRGVEFEAQAGDNYFAFTLVTITGADYCNLYGRDVTAAKRAEAELRASEASYRAIFDGAEEAIFVHDVATGAILDVNAAGSRMYGYTPEEVRALSVADLSASDDDVHDQEQALERIRAAVEGRPQLFEWLARDKAGRDFWVEVSLKRTAINGVDRLLASVRDIGERKKSEEALQLAAKILENTIEGVTVTDPQGVIQMVNPGFTHITGYLPEEAIGQNPRILRSNRHDDEFYRAMWKDILRNGHWAGEIWNRRKDGEAYPEWLTISAIKDAQQRTTHYVAVFHDISDIKRSEERIRHQAYHDALTGLPNRQLFNDRLEVALARASRHAETLAVVFMDLDHFKTINDSLGHAMGDLLLQEVATRVKSCLRQEDTVARLGGDEFIMLLPDISGAEDAVAAASRIRQSLAKGFILGDHELFVTASLGITLFPADGADLETLVKNADMAMYRAKEEGRNSCQLYTPAMNARVLQRLSLESALRKALENGRIIVHYQPKVDLASGRMTGMEALARWVREDGTMVQPQEFIPLAEETGLIVPIGAEVLRQACRQAAIWRGKGHPELTVAVNLSARQFGQHDLVAVVEEALRQSGLPASHLELEITESTAMGNVGAASETLKRLQAMGVNVSLDDFGTGYSSLYYLKQFPINALKIDKFFVQHAPDDPDDAAIVQAIVSMAHSLGLKIVAEGVETAEQLAFLRKLGCEMIQGFIFSKPLPALALGEILAQGRRLSQSQT